MVLLQKHFSEFSFKMVKHAHAFTSYSLNIIKESKNKNIFIMPLEAQDFHQRLRIFEKLLASTKQTETQERSVY